MPINRNALIRFKTIDQCLQNRFRKWTLEDLIEACSDALYEYEGIDKGVSKRTVQADLQVMRSDKLGYNAPIIVIDKKYYTYEDSAYSITNIPLSTHDLDTLHEVVLILDQFKGFSHFQDVTAIIKRLETKIQSFSTDTPSVIDFEKNEALKGLSYLDKLHQAILKKQVLSIDYQPFTKSQTGEIIFHCYLLKEYRNRWFVLGKKSGENEKPMILALDRIEGISESLTIFEEPFFDVTSHFNDVIGVSVPWTGPIYDVIFKVRYYEAPYLITKPLHPSQEVIKKEKDWVIFRLKVKLNYELEREFISLGEKVIVLEPLLLKEKIENRLKLAVENYSI